LVFIGSQDATKPSGKERTLLKQYEILTAGNLEQFIKRKTSDGECYVDTVILYKPERNIGFHWITSYILYRTITEVEYYFDVPHRVTEILITLSQLSLSQKRRESLT
jgi:hypothetical protein